jgi:starvation-inducible DNA-binding protein
MSWSVLPEETTSKIADLLQPTLVDLVDLHLIGKQAHWTVVGERFQSTHEKLDVLVDQWRLWSDQVAERIVTLGHIPRGRANDVVAAPGMTEFPLAWLSDADAIAAVADRVEATAKRAREHQEAVADLDVISDALVQEIVAGLEEQLWMLRAHLR